MAYRQDASFEPIQEQASLFFLVIFSAVLGAPTLAAWHMGGPVAIGLIALLLFAEYVAIHQWLDRRHWRKQFGAPQWIELVSDVDGTLELSIGLDSQWPLTGTVATLFNVIETGRLHKEIRINQSITVAATASGGCTVLNFKMHRLHLDRGRLELQLRPHDTDKQGWRISLESMPGGHH